MAEINIEKKSRPVWPWIIGILILALVIWLLTGIEDTEPDQTSPEPIEEEATGYVPQDNFKNTYAMSIQPLVRKQFPARLG